MPQDNQYLMLQKCLFCSHSNPSYLRRCEKCDGATIPTRGKNQQKLKWITFTFGPCGMLSERNSFSFFSYVKEIFTSQNGIAIRLGSDHNEKKLFTLVRHPEDGQALYSIQYKSSKVTTTEWDKANSEDLKLLDCFVEENLAIEDGKIGKMKSN